MYESPVKIIAENVQMQLEDNVVSAIQKLGIDINKEELIKALDYDRQQYIKGYADGKHDAQFQWIPCSERLPAYGEDVLISIGGCCNVGHIVPVNEEEQYNWYFSGWYHLPNDVDAWMPLPEPWKGEEHGET